MSLLQAYLRNPKTQRALSKKPGQEGFSLIELVIVVAVLAVLAVIAIPAFNGIAEDGRRSAAKTSLANAAKECAVGRARGDNPVQHAALTTGQGLTFNAALTTQACTATEAVVCVANTPVEAYGVNLVNGAKLASSATLSEPVGTCAANSNCEAWEIEKNLWSFKQLMLERQEWLFINRTGDSSSRSGLADNN